MDKPSDVTPAAPHARFARNARTHALLDLTDELVCLIDLSTGTILDISPTLCHRIGRTADDVRGCPYAALQGNATSAQDDLLSRLHALSEDDTRHDLGPSPLTPATGPVALCQTSALVFVEHSRTLAWVRFHDSAEPQSVVSSERRFRLLVENSPDAFFLHDMTGRILDVNQRSSEMLGYTAEELCSMHIWQVETICPPEALLALWRDIRPGSFSFDGLSRRKNGSTFSSEVKGVVFEENGRLLSLVSVRDMTSHKELEKNLQQAHAQAVAANQVKDVFLANMSHEIRTPLNIVLGMAELLRETSLAASQERLVSSIEKSGQVLLRVINDILDISQMQANAIALHPENIRIGEVLEETGEALRLLIEQKGLAFHMDLAAATSRRMRCDPARLQQVLLNLLWNAIKFTPSGSISLTTELVTDADDLEQLRVSITDTGTGIPPHKLECIFEPFTQVETAGNRHFGGTGLGLAICKRLVERMGGRMTVRSSPGNGSTFSFALPLLPREILTTPPPETSVTGTAEAHEVCPAHVLLVEDVLPNQEVVRLFLENEPYTLTTASSGQEALDLCAKKRFNCILMDVEMPGLDGYETTAAIRRLENKTGLRPMPIIVLTAHSIEDYEQRGPSSGCDGYLPKPIRKPLLLQELHRICSKQV